VNRHKIAKKWLLLNLPTPLLGGIKQGSAHIYDIQKANRTKNMMNHKAAGILLSASQRLKMAVEQESLKPQYASEQADASLTFLASAVKQNHPEAFDHDNPADVLIWIFLGD